jgi:hypothetical protein
MDRSIVRIMDKKELQLAIDQLTDEDTVIFFLYKKEQIDFASKITEQVWSDFILRYKGDLAEYTQMDIEGHLYDYLEELKDAEPEPPPKFAAE